MITCALRSCLFFVFLLLSVNGLASAQGKQEVGCGLISWVRAAPAGSTLTPEISLELHDTSIRINNTNRKLRIPNGFKISIFAKAAEARGMAFADDGTLYVTARGNRGSIWAFPDHNKDGVADSNITIKTDVGANVHGIGFYQGKLYYSIGTKLVRLEDDNGDRIADRSTDIATFLGTGGHVTRTFVFDTARKKLFVQVGSSSNMSTGEPEERATMLSFNLDGTGRSIFARGLRNACGMDIDPRTGALWANNNGMDNLIGDHNERPPESVYIICEGADYGWPYAWGNRMPNPEYNTSTDNYAGPVAEVLAHSAPLGMHFYRGTKFPDSYKNALFQTYHGSWNRTPPAPPRVTVMWSNPDGTDARVADFITGFQDPSTSSRFGRPVQVAESPDGDLYISDDLAGVIYRVTTDQVSVPVVTLSLDDGSLNGKTFTPGSTIAITWQSENTDTIEIYFRNTRETPWQLQGTATSSPFQWTVPSVRTTLGQIRLLDKKSGTESVESGSFTIEALDVDPAPEHVIKVRVENESKLYLSSSTPQQLHAEIFDILGKSQGVLYDGILMEELSYNLKSANATAGVYFLRVQSGNDVQTIRIRYNGK